MIIAVVDVLPPWHVKVAHKHPCILWLPLFFFCIFKEGTPSNVGLVCICTILLQAFYSCLQQPQVLQASQHAGKDCSLGGSMQMWFEVKHVFVVGHLLIIKPAGGLLYLLGLELILHSEGCT